MSDRMRSLRRLDDREFNELEDRVDRFAAEAAKPPAPDERRRGFDPAHNESDFEELVRDALDEIPEEFQPALDGVAVVVSDRGHERNRLGEYAGYGVAGRKFIWKSLQVLPDRIVVFRDTLVRDYGTDPERLRAEVRRTVLHELAHHLGFAEADMRRLGL